MNHLRILKSAPFFTKQTKKSNHGCVNVNILNRPKNRILKSKDRDSVAQSTLLTVTSLALSVLLAQDHSLHYVLCCTELFTGHTHGGFTCGIVSVSEPVFLVVWTAFCLISRLYNYDLLG